MGCFRPKVLRPGECLLSRVVYAPCYFIVSWSSQRLVIQASCSLLNVDLPAPLLSIRPASATMVEDKKTDDYTVQMDKLDQGNKEFEAAPPPPQPRPVAVSSKTNNPIFPVLAYCGSSIMMTVMNKYVLSGLDFNLNFLLLMVQVCGNMQRLFSSASGLILYSPLSVLLRSSLANPWDLSPTATLPPMRRESVSAR